MQYDYHFLDPLIKSDLPPTLPLKVLNILANNHTGNSGDSNYIFKYLDEEIIINDETQDHKMVDVLANDEDNDGKYEIECYEVKANLFWGKDIVVKNSTKRKLRAEVSYHTRDFHKEKSQM